MGVRFAPDFALMIILGISVLFTACEVVNSDLNNEPTIGSGLEIYLTQSEYIDNLDLDYNNVNLDTIALKSNPMLSYKDLLSYDTTEHKFTLRISHDVLKIGESGVYGRMFIVTIDKKPIYCGFNWPVISSIPCNWIYIEEPYEELDGLEDNEILIKFNSLKEKDPRLNRIIVERPEKDGKISS